MKIESLSEFSWSIVQDLPRAYYHHVKEIPYEVVCHRGLKDVFYFCDNVKEIEHPVRQGGSQIYSNEAPKFISEKWWLPPPIKAHYSGAFSFFQKETVVIQNKYTKEWGRDPLNYFDLETLRVLMSILSDKYQVIYIRPEGDSKGYYSDDNTIIEFPDYAMIAEEFPDVFTMRDAKGIAHDKSYNWIQYSLQASSEKHISVSGGNACLSAYFGGELLIFDNPNGTPRGVWETGSWLSQINDSKVTGFRNRDNLVKFVSDNWI